MADEQTDFSPQVETGLFGGMDPTTVMSIMLVGQNPRLKHLIPLMIEAGKQQALQKQAGQIGQALQKVNELRASGDMEGAMKVWSSVAPLVSPQMQGVFAERMFKGQEQAGFGKALQAYDPSIPQNALDVLKYAPTGEALKLAIPHQFQQGGVVQPVPQLQGQATPSPTMISQRLELPSPEIQARFPAIMPLYNSYNQAIQAGDQETANKVGTIISGIPGLNADIVRQQELQTTQGKSNIEEARQQRMLSAEETSANRRKLYGEQVGQQFQLSTAERMNPILEQRTELDTRARILASPLPTEVQRRIETLRDTKRTMLDVEANFDPAFVGKGFSKLSDEYNRAFATQEEAASKGQYVPGTIFGELREFFGQASGQEIVFRRALADVADRLLRARSGAQINEQEYARLRGLLPTLWNEPNTFVPALQRFNKDLDSSIQNSAQLALTPSGKLTAEALLDVGKGVRYQPPGPSKATPGPTIPRFSIDDAFKQFQGGPPSGGQP